MNIRGKVEDSGEGRWTVNAAIDEAVPGRGADGSAVCALPFAQGPYFREKILSAMRAGFGGHKEPKKPDSKT